MKRFSGLWEKNNILVIFLVAGFIIVPFICRIIKGSKIDANGVYTLGKLYKKNSGGKNVPTMYFKYYFNEKLYTTSIGGYGLFVNDSGYVYMKINSIEPTENIILEFNKVPICFNFKIVPNNGWAVLPKDTCTLR